MYKISPCIYAWPTQLILQNVAICWEHSRIHPVRGLLRINYIIPNHVFSPWPYYEISHKPRCGKGSFVIKERELLCKLFCCFRWFNVLLAFHCQIVQQSPSLEIGNATAWCRPHRSNTAHSCTPRWMRPQAVGCGSVGMSSLDTSRQVLIGVTRVAGEGLAHQDLVAERHGRICGRRNEIRLVFLREDAVLRKAETPTAMPSA